MNNIGLIIWGTKGGYRLFGSHNIDFANNKDIAGTIKDARDFVRFNKAKVDYFALEFTNMYKVYTIYRSAYEVSGSSGAYVAITLYIPHEEKIPEIYDLLNKLMDTYFSHYVDSVSMCIKGIREDINLFVNLINKAKVERDKSRTWKSAAPNNSPVLILYPNTQYLQRLLTAPYRKRYTKAQKITFLSKEVHDNLENYRGVFTSTPNYLDESEIEEELQSFSFEQISSMANFTLESFLKNGRDIKTTYFTEEFDEQDTISIQLSKPYYASFTGNNITIEQAIDEGIILLERRKLILNENIHFSSLRHEIKIVNSGNWQNFDEIKLYLTNATTSGIRNIGDKFVLKSEQIGQAYQVFFQPDKGYLKINTIDKIMPSETVDICLNIFYYKINYGLENKGVCFIGKNGRKDLHKFRSTDDVCYYIAVNEGKPIVQIDGIEGEIKEEEKGRYIYLSKVTQEVFKPVYDQQQHEYKSVIPQKDTEINPNITYHYKIILNYKNKEFDDNRFKLYIGNDYSTFSNENNIISISVKSNLYDKEITIRDINSEFEDCILRFDRGESKYYVDLVKRKNRNGGRFNLYDLLKKKIWLYIIAILIIGQLGVFVWLNGIPSLSKKENESGAGNGSVADTSSQNTTVAVQTEVPATSTITESAVVQIEDTKSKIQAAWNKLDSMSCSMEDVQNLKRLLQENPTVRPNDILKDDTVRQNFGIDQINKRVELYESFFKKAMSKARNENIGLGNVFLGPLYLTKPNKWHPIIYPSYFSKDQKQLFRKINEPTAPDGRWNYILMSSDITNPTFNDINKQYE